MKNHRSLRHSILQVGGLAGGTHRAPSAGIGRIRAMRGILVLALTLGSLGAVLLALPGHVSAGRARAGAQQSANGPDRSAAHHLALSKTTPKAWMY
jgi:hypothetical protein